MLCTCWIYSFLCFYERLSHSLCEASRKDHEKVKVSHMPFHARGLALETTVCFGTFIHFKIFWMNQY